MTSRGPIFRMTFYLLVVALVSSAACSAERTGRVEIALQVASGVTLTAATYDVIAPDGTLTTGTVAVAASSDVPVAIAPLPIANGYQLIVSGVASNGTTGCSGTSGFDVTDGAPTTVIVHLVCGQPPSTGQLLVSGSLNVCPLIDGVSASPSNAVIGAPIGLGVTAHDADAQPAPLAFAWSATAGSLSATTGAAPLLTCLAAGKITVTVSGSDGDAGCTDQMSFDVTCTEP
ncbi:MAG TPA: hypothetical protein VHM31_19145 [Polyangia bacterium]|nr:hypothetical protein [Polyangia bacterium]